MLSALTVGSTFSTPQTAIVLGAILAHPTTDAWPNLSSLTQVDQDGDMKPGITLATATDTGYSMLPVNPLRTVRADHVDIALRSIMSATGTVDSCTTGSGKVTVPTIGTKASIDTHILGCRVTNGTDCTAAEFELLDSAQPVYTPMGTGTVAMKKVADNASCAVVRASF
jgi:hypothetical protein